MKTILLNSPIFLEKSSCDLEDTLPPIGLGYIASYLQKNGIEVELIDAVDKGLISSDIIELLHMRKPDFTGINIFTTNFNIVKYIVESVKIRTHFIIGGPAAKELYTEIIKWETVNLIDIVIGDGELITHDIIKYDVKQIPYLNGGKRRVFTINENSVYYVKNISDITLNRQLFRNDPVLNYWGLSEANIVTSRGCINNCAFCSAARSQNQENGLRERTIHSIIKELDDIRADFPEVRSIRILDDLFLKSKRSIVKAIDIFSRFDFLWRSMACVSTFYNLEQKEINKLFGSGCVEIFTGIESGSSKILRSINKNLTQDTILTNVEKLFRAGIKVKGYFLYGFPGETLEDMEMTYNLATEIKEISIKHRAGFRTSVFQFRPYHGTELYKRLTEKNIHIGQIAPNEDLSRLIGKKEFNFSSGNYSEVEDSTLLAYISKTNDLNGSGKTTVRIPKPYKPKQKQNM